MTNKGNFSLRNTSGLIQLVLLLGLVVLMVFAITFARGSASRDPATSEKSRSEEMASNLPTPNATESFDRVADWELYLFDNYGLAIRYPPDLFVSQVDSIKPAGAISSHVFAPDENNDFLGPQVPMLILTIYGNSESALIDWFYDHATKKEFDDPSVRMKDSPYYFREYTDPEPIKFAGQEGLRFTSRTMSGMVNHVLILTPDRSNILDWGSNDHFESEYQTTFETMLSTLDLSTTDN